MSNHPVLGKNEPDFVGQVLGTGYLSFESSVGMDGLAKEVDDGKGLDILALVARHEGQGSLRKFIALAKEHYDKIYIWSVWNRFLPAVLVRYGFMPFVRFEDGHKIDGYRWCK